MSPKQKLNIEEIRRNLKTKWLGKKIHYLSETDSTNNVARELAEQGFKEGTIVVSETQTRGKGRLGRKWISPKGGIWLSIILKPKIKPSELIKITLLTAVAVAKAIKEELNINAEIKWPNDVLVDERKVCGILTETFSQGEKLQYVIVGIGINANFDISVFPEELRRTATSLKKVLGREINRERLICSLLRKMEFYYEALMKGRTKAILNEWRKLSSMLGYKVEVSSFKERFEGTAVDIDNEGWLIVKLDDGTLKKIVSGDVTVRKKTQNTT